MLNICLLLLFYISRPTNVRSYRTVLSAVYIGLGRKMQRYIFDAFFGDLDGLAILIGLSVYAISRITVIYCCLLKCAYLVTPCTICFLLTVCTKLRYREHDFQLPDYCSALHKRSFVIRTSFEFV